MVHILNSLEITSEDINKIVEALENNNPINIIIGLIGLISPFLIVYITLNSSRKQQLYQYKLNNTCILKHSELYEQDFELKKIRKTQDVIIIETENYKKICTYELINQLGLPFIKVTNYGDGIALDIQIRVVVYNKELGEEELLTIFYPILKKDESIYICVGYIKWLSQSTSVKEICTTYNTKGFDEVEYRATQKNKEGHYTITVNKGKKGEKQILEGTSKQSSWIILNKNIK